MPFDKEISVSDGGMLIIYKRQQGESYIIEVYDVKSIDLIPSLEREDAISVKLSAGYAAIEKITDDKLKEIIEKLNT